MSAGLDLPRDGRLARTAREVPLWLLHAPDAPEDARAYWQGRGARLIPCAEGPGGLEPLAALQALAAAGLTRVFCEGGGRLAAALLAADLVDEIAAFHAGLALGAEARPMLGPF